MNTRYVNACTSVANLMSKTVSANHLEQYLAVGDRSGIYREDKENSRRS